MSLKMTKNIDKNISVWDPGILTVNPDQYQEPD